MRGRWGKLIKRKREGDKTTEYEEPFSPFWRVRKRDVCADREADENILFTGEMPSEFLQRRPFSLL
jgi:hypothetical protein